jgi:hypothetical protein
MKSMSRKKERERATDQSLLLLRGGGNFLLFLKLRRIGYLLVKQVGIFGRLVGVGNPAPIISHAALQNLHEGDAGGEGGREREAVERIVYSVGMARWRWCSKRCNTYRLAHIL